MLITVDEYKSAKGIESDLFDEQLEMLLPMVEEAVEEYCGRSFRKALHTEQRQGIVDNSGVYLFQCKNTPIIVASGINAEISYVGASLSPVNVELTNASVMSETGVIKYAGSTREAMDFRLREEFSYKITYVGGYDSCNLPKTLKLAVINAMSDLFNYYYGDQIAQDKTTRLSEKSSVRIADYSENRVSSNDKLKTNGNLDNGLLLSATTRMLLSKYKRASMA